MKKATIILRGHGEDHYDSLNAFVTGAEMQGEAEEETEVDSTVEERDGNIFKILELKAKYGYTNYYLSYDAKTEESYLFLAIGASRMRIRFVNFLIKTFAKGYGFIHSFEYC